MSRTYSLGILFKDNAMCGLTHDYFAGILNGFKLQAEELGYEITFINAGTRHDKKTILEHVKDRKIEGVGIICTDLNDPEVQELLGSDIPLVTIDEPDNEQGIRNLVYHIAGMGHKKIAYIHGDMNSVTGIRINGFKDACNKMGIDVPKEYIRECNYRDTKKASFETEALLRLPDSPTCIIYPDDYAAIGGINILKAYGLSIPDDISIAGYDGIGRTAAKTLITLIDSPDSITGLDDIIIETSLSEGNTVRHISVEE